MTQSLDIQYKSLELLQMFIPDPLYGNTATGPTMRRPRAWLRHHPVVRLLSQHLCHLSWYNLLIKSSVLAIEDLKLTSVVGCFFLFIGLKG